MRKLGLVLLLAAFVVLPSAPLLAGYSSQPAMELPIAAATNLTEAFTTIATQCQTETGITVTLNLGTTGNLATQIRDGAPFGLFAVADVVTVNALIQDGFMLAERKTLSAPGDECLV